MKTTVQDVRHQPTKVPYASPWLVLLDVDKRWRRVRQHGCGNSWSAYVHVGDHVLYLQSSFKPERGDVFARLEQA